MPQCLLTPELNFTPQAWEQMQQYLRLSTYEISGFGRVQELDGRFLCDDIVIFKQEVSAGHTELDDLALAQFHEEVTAAGQKPQEYGRLWWHSHAKGSLYFSQTDWNTICYLARPYAFGIVGNQSGGVKVAYSQKPYNNHMLPAMVIDDVKCDVSYQSEASYELCREEILQKVTYRPPATQRVQYSGKRNGRPKRRAGQQRYSNYSDFQRNYNYADPAADELDEHDLQSGVVYLTPASDGGYIERYVYPNGHPMEEDYGEEF